MPEENIRVYQLRIQANDKLESVLAFSGWISEGIDRLFEERYDSGRDFIANLEDKKQQILDAIVQGYQTSKKNFTYTINEDKLIIAPLSQVNGQGDMSFVCEQNDFSAMAVMTMFLGNYLHIKKLLSSVDKPLTVRKSFENRYDESFKERGKAPYDELVAIMSGKEKPGKKREYIEIAPILLSVN